MILRIDNYRSFVVDIDECRQDTKLCPSPGNCVNTLGSYRCLCPKHYKLDTTGNRCVDPKQTKHRPNECFGPDCDNFDIGKNNNNNNNNNGCHDNQVQTIY